MSVETLIANHGAGVSLIRPTQTANSEGAMARQYESAGALRAFVQPRSSNDAPFSGRALQQDSVTFYFAGQPDIRTDDLLQVGSAFYHVTGVRVPILRAVSRGNCHTIVDTTQRNGDTVTVVVAP
jgi:head-tail adaptor